MAAQIEQPAVSTAPEVRIRNLSVAYQTSSGLFDAVHDLELDIPKGSIAAVIGESGSGKSTLAMAMLNSVTFPGVIRSGSIDYAEQGDILKFDRERLRRFRGEHAGMVFQASQDTLNPLKRVGAQLLDLARSHGIKDKRKVLREAAELAERMALPADRVLTSYQHELSGGMRQRVSIIFALALHPRIVLLDEPTTALDVLSQSHVLEIIREIHRERGLTTLLITHDMGVVAELSHRVVVMYAGRIVEDAPSQELLRKPLHPYSQALIRAIPRLTGSLEDARALPGAPLELRQIPQQGCVFRDRCPVRMPICDTVTPVLREVVPGRRVACHLEDM